MFERTRLMLGEWMIETLIAVVGAFLSALIWLIRLEGKVTQQARDLDRISDSHDKLVEKHDSLEEKILEKISIMSESMVRMEERIKRIS